MVNESKSFQGDHLINKGLNVRSYTQVEPEQDNKYNTLQNNWYEFIWIGGQAKDLSQQISSWYDGTEHAGILVGIMVIAIGVWQLRENWRGTEGREIDWQG